NGAVEAEWGRLDSAAIAARWRSGLRKGADDLERVVRDQSSPRERPECGDRFRRISTADGLVQRSKKRRPTGTEHVKDCAFAIRNVRLKPDTTPGRRDTFAVIRARVSPSPGRRGVRL